nr:hypothetical protein GCM10020185_77500 [Pseudomonas brassicacearum subsp. brassicacearum]
MYSGDLNFDGVAANFNHKLNQDWGVFGTVGAFPVEYTNDTSTSNGSDKEESDNKWLYGAQLGGQLGHQRQQPDQGGHGLLPLRRHRRPALFVVPALGR